MTTLLSVEGLKTYLSQGDTQVKAVDDISFKINKGETFCLVGESGSGKSICALSIIQLLPNAISSHPAGVINFQLDTDKEKLQVNMLSLSDSQKNDIRGSRIAMIFQEPMTSLNPVMTIGDQIVESLQLHWPEISYEAAKLKTITALQQVQIPEAEQRFDDYPHRLSGGQRQRVMIAMAMACEPDLLIADEPTTALDVTVQAEILKLMKSLQARTGMSILFITHDFGVVSEMADQVAVMKKGKLVEIGDVKKILTTPQHIYTQELIAALPEKLKKKRLQEQTNINEGETSSKVETENNILEIENLEVYFPIKKGVFRKTVDYVKAVDGINLNIPKGQILSLVGESGCGKTTLGRAILRLHESTRGKIKFVGKDITHLLRKDMQPYRQRIQAVFQDPMSSLNPRLTIATTLVEPMAVHSIGSNYDERIEKAKQALLNVQLDENYLWRYPHEFSGGQRQRIGIARALVLQPEFIVCDEITSALDVSVQAEILKILLSLREQHSLTLLFITHNISVVEYISDYVAVMRQGKIVEYGKTGDVCNNPQQRYTQELMAAVPRIAF